ncbi:MAG: heme-binding domain-containing protein [Candidatus Binatia bacterium]
MQREKVGKVIRWAIAGLLIVFILIQLVPVDRTNPPVETEIAVPTNVRAILRQACYDCHSNETVWPWYSKVAPVSWLVVHDVQEGREALNFSTWNRYTTKQQVKKMKESWEETAEGEMPPWFYLAVHRDAGLSADEHAVLRAWALSASPEQTQEDDD